MSVAPPLQEEVDTVVWPAVVQETLVDMGSAFADNAKMPRKVKMMADFNEMAPVLSLLGFFDSVICNVALHESTWLLGASPELESGSVLVTFIA